MGCIWQPLQEQEPGQTHAAEGRSAKPEQAARRGSGQVLKNKFARAKHLKSQLLSVGTTLADDELTLSVLNAC